MARLKILGGGLVLVVLIMVGCGGSYKGDEIAPPQPTTPEEGLPTFSLVIQVIDEAGNPVEGALVNLGVQALSTNNTGQVQFSRLEGPLVGVISRSGFLPEPVVVGWEEAGRTLRVSLFGDGGGTRWAMHSTGDVMFGRRYGDPPFGDPLIPANNISEGARQVVANIQPIFAAADFSTVNLETTVSNLSGDNAYPGKRFILNSPVDTLSALQYLGTDLVVLANNHTRDYSDQGVRATMDALNGQGLAFQGLGTSDEEATQPNIQTIKGFRIGTLAYTSVTGSFVNDNYPRDNEPQPADLPESEIWQYQPRNWGFSGPNFSAPVANRRIGEVWHLFSENESKMEPGELAAAWASLAAVYPEMQDWVARRGHGGAAMWQTASATAAISQLKLNADVVMVQLHSGFQYQENPSESLRDNARRAIDAGADIVVCHHPHVLQGLEWYKGKLIAYSLGNFVFDQDFLATFSSAFLRTVWEGDRLLQARVIPFEIQAYHPTPVAGVGARRTLLRLWEMSLNDAQSIRISPTVVRSLTYDPDPDTQRAHFSLSNHSGIVSDVAPQLQTMNITLRPGETVALDYDTLVHGRLGLAAGDNPSIEVGRDSFGWGRFEDEVADNLPEGGTHWALSGNDKNVILGDAHGGARYLKVSRHSSDAEPLLIRPVARVALPEHRLFQQAGEQVVAIDPSPSYSFRFHIRLKGITQVRSRFDIYAFDDTDPTEDPESLLLNLVEQVLEIQPDSGWQQFDIGLDQSQLITDGVRGNMTNFYLWLAPPSSSTAELDIDDLEFIEWRQADQMPDRFGMFTHIRNRGSQTVTLAVPAMALKPGL